MKLSFTGKNAGRNNFEIWWGGGGKKPTLKTITQAFQVGKLNQSISQFSHSVMSHSATPWTAAHQTSLSNTNYQGPPKPMSIESGVWSNHLILCCPLILPPSIFPSIRVFSNVPVLHIRWPKYLSFSFRINPFNEYSGLISFQMDWLDILAVQGAFKNLLQKHSSKASIFQHSAFFMVQLSHPYMTTGKT